MKNLNIMLKPASSLCNMRCKYCFYADVAALREVKSCGVMSGAVMNRIIENVFADLEVGDAVTFVFQGGEPMLAGLDFFRCFAEKVDEQRQNICVNYALQTNGVLLDDEWCAFLKENRFLVGISLDILSDCHNAVRVDSEGKGTYGRVIEGINFLKKHKVEYNVLCTLTNSVARHPKLVWKRILELDVEYVQFTPCLGALNSEKESVYALTPKRFADFYIQLFGCWLEEFRKGNYRSVKFFDDCVNLMMYGRPTSCGMNGHCQPQLVVEADGTAYPCDFYCLDEYALGNLTEATPLELLKSQRVREFLCREHKKPTLCEKCQFERFCGGNCKRMQKEICCSGDDEYCGYREFLMKCGLVMMEIAKKYRR